MAGVSVIHGNKRYNVIDHFDGTRWTRLQVNNPERFAQLVGLGIVAPNDVWAVGYQSRTSIGPVSPLIEHWNGTAWSEVRHAPFVEGNVLSSVTVVSANDVWAIGGRHIEHWNGRAWSVVTPSLAPSGISGATHIPGTNSIWAVGNYLSPYLNIRALSALFHC
jgi:hypothetical protein